MLDSLSSSAFFVMKGGSMNDDFNKILNSYRDAGFESLMMFNWTVSFVTIITGALELLRRYNKAGMSVLIFSDNATIDIIFASVFIILGLMVVIFFNKTRIYRKVVYLLATVWIWVYFSQLADGLSQIPNLKHILILPIVIQLFYMMKASVFLDEND